MTIRKSLKSMARLTSLFLLALAVVPAIASYKVTDGGVTVWTTFNGDHDHAFELHADYRGEGNKTCAITVKMTIKDGEKRTTKTFPVINFTVSGRDYIQSVGDGEVSDNEAPLANPELSGGCK
jgi:hypothetical protein